DIDFDDVGYCIDGDYDWLLDAFSNVISNSAEHADKVYIGVETSREKCVITIKDNGGGFEKENIDKIFDRFESGNGAKTFHMGIGLNLAKLVIEAHYGKISAYNDYEAGGAVFKIVLPQYQLKKGKI
ncbi:MAG: HAMP domain-containing sensor histidine kinase, partial [Eubacteriales bacterium]|nr:HAMP domain-containing sensor histidine kinase [Eubacteriales bacterium]